MGEIISNRIKSEEQNIFSIHSYYNSPVQKRGIKLEERGSQSSS
jgi:hypothetical protein